MSGGLELMAPAAGAPSQFFRRCLSTWLGADDGEWDWLVYPQTERVKAMMNAAPRCPSDQ